MDSRLKAFKNQFNKCNQLLAVMDYLSKSLLEKSYMGTSICMAGLAIG
jgi:hypothetical protein